MTLSLDLQGIAEHLGIHPSQSCMDEIETALHAEIDSIGAYSDAIKVTVMLQERGVVVGICSNLVKPYGAAVKRLFTRRSQGVTIKDMG
ncbi:hypothetical protein [Pseudomonas sp. NPDC089401]|uniref:hypothetical protein n=1 Tax=Pseudomonas sp. NPDC089401 TaxID=3364462 RepID=UPI00381082AC